MLGVTALRAARLLAELRERRMPVDRAGRGTVCEVYPAASRSAWELTRVRDLTELLSRLPLEVMPPAERARPRCSPSPSSPRVGLLEHDARELGIDLDVRYSDTSGWYSNYRIGETTAAAKVLIDRSTDRIVGAHLLGPDYTELINILGLAMKLDLTTRQLKSMPAAYPTIGSDLGSML